MTLGGDQPGRRAFLRAAGSALLAACAPAVRTSGRDYFNVVIRGGTVFDGSGNPGFESDVGIIGERVTAVSRALIGRGAVELDARGLAVAPGFIDIHSHAEDTLFDDPRAESAIRQGITTVVVGQDGFSAAPATREDLRRALARSPGDAVAFPTVDEFFRAVDAAAPGVNVTTMVGLGTVRHSVMGDLNRPPTTDELRRMTALVADALVDGACGASSGLEYTPGAFASPAELVALCRPLANASLPYATHLRNEDDGLLEAVEEALGVARLARCPLQISHLKTEGPRNWPKLGALLSRLEEAREEKLDVTFDRYPYIAFETSLSNLFPSWSREGGIDGLLARVDDPGSTSRLRGDVLAKVTLLGGWDTIMIASVSEEVDRPAEGQRLRAYADLGALDPYDLVVALLRRNRGNVEMVAFAMSEPNLQHLLAHPRSMICTDGGLLAIDPPGRIGHPHPRSFGSFPRVLGRYVRERRDLSLAAALYRMTGFPAARLRLADRGRIAPGTMADIVVFDPATIRDRATFGDPFQYPDGIVAVLVNGSFALREGVRVAERFGGAIRRR